MNIKSQSGRALPTVIIIIVVIILALGSFAYFTIIPFMREGARRAKCLSNLKQLGLALKCHADNNNKYLPFVFNDMEPCQSFGQLHPEYVSSLDLFRCPSSNDDNWDITTAHVNNKDNAPFTKETCRNCLSYAYGYNKYGMGNKGRGPWRLTNNPTTRIAADKYVCVDYSKSDGGNKSSNHGNAGRNILLLDGSALWDEWNGPLESDPKIEYRKSGNPGHDQTGPDWWSDPPEKP